MNLKALLFCEMTNKTKRNYTLIKKTPYTIKYEKDYAKLTSRKNNSSRNKTMTIFITRCNILVCFKYCRELATCNHIFIHIS